MVFDKVCDIVAQQLNIEKEDITPETNLQEDLHIESLDMIEYIVIVEHEFDIDIPDEDMPNLATIQDVVTYIEENMR
jgi:acyl carrier protein